MINLEKLQPVLEGYKQYFPEHWQNEKFKWETVKRFQDCWDIDAENFAEMFKAATDKTEGLLASGYAYPRAMIIRFAEADSEAVRTMFRNLFDESQDLAARVESFKKTSEEIRKKYDPGTWKSHYQNTNAISTYLWLKYPDKYYIYKFELFKKAAVELNTDYIPQKGDDKKSLAAGYQMYDEICNAIKQDSDLVEMIRKALDDRCYADPELKTATIDVCFYLARFYLDGKEKKKSEWFPDIEDYTPGISIDEWVALLNDQNIFDDSCLAIMKRFDDFGGQATCVQLAKKYGENYNFYNNKAKYLGRRVAEKTGCQLLLKNNEDSRWWPVLFVGKEADRNTPGVYIWKLREELAEAIKRVDLSSIPLYAKPESGSANSMYELVITAEKISSTDKRFTMDDLNIGDKYKVEDAYFQRGEEIVYRKLQNGETRISNKTLPRLAMQVFESQIKALSEEEKKAFPVCRYKPSTQLIAGIFPSEAAFKRYKNTIEFVGYKSDNGEQFYIYCWNIFTTILFVQECLKRFGELGDKFVLRYRDKAQDQEELPIIPVEPKGNKGITGEYALKLLKSKNVILHGAPGTGKTHLVKEIAAEIISDGETDDFRDLSPEQKEQFEFVQFHPSYDYTDFVEGLRPKNDNNGIGFELKEGIFKKFVLRALKNHENSKKTRETLEKEVSAQEAINDFFSGIEYGVDKFKTITGREFYVTNIDDKHIYISIPDNLTVNKLTLSMDEVRKLVESGQNFEKITDITSFFRKQFATQGYSYDFVLYKEIIKKKAALSKATLKQEPQEQLKRYIFAIDEINRGEISKIFGELFFSIDPGYRGEKGAVSTQYANLHDDPDEKFYIPSNVYIIGTMNDIDRSVDSFDFAMRRRFRFVEIKANDRLDMLDELGEDKKADAVERMERLNAAIVKVPDLNENYQIGAAYFLKLKDVSVDELWSDSLEPLLQEYVRGLSDDKEYMKSFKDAYYNSGNATESEHVDEG